MSHGGDGKRTVIRFLLENSLFLIFGAIAGLVWANTANHSYHDFVHTNLVTNDFIGHLHHGHYEITVHWLVNDILMAFFFAIAGKEVFEATLPGGPLNNPKKAAVPLVAAIGGMIGPALLYLGGAYALGQFKGLSNGWAIPCATDIAFSYMVARLIFGAGHPAIPFLLLLAIADDAMGLIILAVFYPQGPVEPLWMLLPVVAVVLGMFFHKKLKLHSFWWYILIPGIISWFGFFKAGLHPALGLLPIIPTMPHAHVDLGLFNWREMERNDTLDRFEHWWKNPVEIILGLFGLLNAGVLFSAIAAPTWLILVGLIVGKPVGIFFSAVITGWVLKVGLPEGISKKDLVVMGFAAAIGFTVALFVAGVAFKPGPVQDAAKMGALFSFAAAILTFIVAKVLGVSKHQGGAAANAHGH